MVHFTRNNQRPERAGWGWGVQLHNTGLSAEVEGAGDESVPKRECCSVGTDISGETAQMENEELTGCVRSKHLGVCEWLHEGP